MLELDVLVGVGERTAESGHFRQQVLVNRAMGWTTCSNPGFRATVDGFQNNFTRELPWTEIFQVAAPWSVPLYKVAINNAGKHAG